MRKFSLLSTSVAAMLVASLPVTPAQAQLNTSFVASTGSGSACTRAAPCTGFAAAAAVTNSGGQINCLDSGPYSGFTLIKSLTIDCAGTAATVNAIVMTGTGLEVKIRNIVINGKFISAAALVGFTGGGTLFIENCLIENAVNSPSIGIQFAPSESGAQLVVTDTKIINSGSGVTSGGIVIKPTSGGTANVSVSRADLVSNVNGIFVDGSGGGNGVNLNVRDSLVTGSSNSGIVVATTGQPVTALIDRTTVNYSLNTGVAVAGAAATVRLGNSTISNNVTGVAAFSSASLRSFKNNQIKANFADGTPIAAAEGLD